MTALENWKNDFKEFISELSISRDDYKGIMEYIDEVPNEALEQQPCEDWYDVPSDEMTLEQARQAVKDLRKKLAEDLEKNRENLINQKATTCRHGGHCEWVACDKCNHYEPDGLNQQPCEDAVSRDCDKCAYYDDGANDEACDECFADEYEHPNFKPKAQHYDDAVSRQAVDELSKELVHTTRDKADFLCNFWEGLQKLPSVTPKEKTGHWKPIEYDGYADGYPVWDVWECSKCGGEHNGDKESLTAFCPDCGAKMIEPQESEE